MAQKRLRQSVKGPSGIGKEMIARLRAETQEHCHAHTPQKQPPKSPPPHNGPSTFFSNALHSARVISGNLKRDQQARRASGRRDSSGALAPRGFEDSVMSDLSNIDELTQEAAREFALFEHVFADFDAADNFGQAPTAKATVKKEVARGEPIVVDLSGVDRSVLEKLKRELPGPVKREPGAHKAPVKQETGVERAFVDLTGLETVVDLVKRELLSVKRDASAGPVLVNLVGMDAVLDLTSLLAPPSSTPSPTATASTRQPCNTGSGSPYAESRGENVDPNGISVQARRSKRILVRNSKGGYTPTPGAESIGRKSGVRTPGRQSNSVNNSRYVVPNPSSVLGAWVYYYTGPITRNRARMMGRRPESF